MHVCTCVCVCVHGTRMIHVGYISAKYKMTCRDENSHVYFINCQREVLPACIGEKIVACVCRRDDMHVCTVYTYVRVCVHVCMCVRVYTTKVQEHMQT